MTLSKRNILLLGIDGARWDIVAEDGAADTVSTLARQGRRHDMTMEVPTISGPGWASILTGTTHAEHGIRDNSLQGKDLWRHPDVLSRAFYDDQTTRTFAAVGWPVLADPAGPGPIIHWRKEQQLAELHRVMVFDGETYGYRRADAEVATAAGAYLAKIGFDFGFVYFCLADATGHLHGLLGEEYRSALRTIDGYVSSLIDLVRTRAEEHDEDWLVVITTDHGHRDEGGHGGASARERESWVVTWSPSGSVPDWPPVLRPEQLADLILEERVRGA